MSELDALGAFRTDVAPPSASVREAARARLSEAIRQEARPRSARRLTSPTTIGDRVALVGGLAGVIVATVLAVGVLDRDPGVLERAQAALDPHGRILHVQVRVVDDGVTTVGESWVLADGSLGRSFDGSGGPASECLGTATELRCFDRKRGVIDVYRYNPEAVDKGERLGELPQFRIDRPESLGPALDSGYARLLGETEFEGKPVYSVLLAVPRMAPDGTASPMFLEGTSPTLYVDRETYYPVAERFPDAGSTTFYDRFEFLPADATNRKLLELSAPAGTNVVVHPVGEGPRS